LKKDVVFIVSGGRTGTRFFGDLLSQMVADSFSVHEPDVFEGFTRRTWERMETFGLYHMVIGRLLGKTGIRNLSQQYLSGTLDLDSLAEAVRNHRLDYFGSVNPSLIVESYSQWYGILPSLPLVFPSYKVVGIIRDPRTWVASNTNHGAQYGPKDLVAKLGLRRLDPEMIGDREFEGKWSSMSAFQKLCWNWKIIYGLIADFVETDPNSKAYRYEDLFQDTSPEGEISHMFDFLTDFPGRRYTYNLDDSLLQKPLHAAGRANFPDWPEWDTTHACQLNDICGTLMEQFGYGNEAAWRDLIRESPAPGS